MQIHMFIYNGDGDDDDKEEDTEEANGDTEV